MEDLVNQQTYLISFENASAAQASQYAENLRNALLDAIPDIQAKRKRHDPTAQDAGQQLLIQILTSPATGTISAAVVGLLATTVTKWLARHPNATLTFKRPEGDVIANGINSRTVVKLTKILLQDNEEKERSN
jgi:hypothetical protein